MATATEILTLTQWFSPGFPIGAFAYSHGLEWAIDTGAVTTADQTNDWISDVLLHGAGWNDCLFINAAYKADPGELEEIDALSRALCASAERLRETDLQGAAFCDITAKVWSVNARRLTYPVAVGRAAKSKNLPLELTTKFYLHAFVANLVTVAMRSVPLGQTEGQKQIASLTPVCCQIAEDTRDGSLENLASSTFLSDIASMKHETQYSRIFRT